MIGFARWVEGNGLGIRQLVGLNRVQRLRPHDVAEKLSIVVCFPQDIDGLASDSLAQLEVVDPAGWSGASAILPNSRLAVILNRCDSVTRHNITLMEEISHDYLGHRPSLATKGPGGLALRNFKRSCEKQAYAVAAAAILPVGRLELLTRRGLSVAEIAAQDEVSPQLVSYRINVTGVRALAASAHR